MQSIRLFHNKKSLPKQQLQRLQKALRKYWGNIKSLNREIFSTLAYHSIFEYPLTIEEICRFLISDCLVAQNSVQKEVSELVRSKKIAKDDKWYSIPLSLIPYPLSLKKFRQNREKISRTKFFIAHRAAHIIGQIPWVKLVAVTGALAMNNADENDDIDLMIVTAKDRLWLIRPMVMFLIGLFFRLRRPHWTYVTHKLHVSNSICLNLWLDESALEIPESQQNLYTAHELAQMKPIVNKDGTYERMMWENRWGEKYLANVWGRFHRMSPIRQIRHISLIGKLNQLLFILQFQYMQSKMTNERVSLHGAFFHPGDRGQAILLLYKMTLDKNKIDI